ncbi:acyltransferase [Agrobacterium salinitolerans]|nr:acyltransferase [Agrobacterium salinitolerans]
MQTVGQRLATHGNDDSNNFTLIRVLAALAVVYGHCFALAKSCEGCVDPVLTITKWRYSGDIALFIFFFISGFLITASLHKNRSFVKFFGARFKRIFPGLLVFILFVTFIIGPFYTSISLPEYLANGNIWKFVVSNATMKEMIFVLPGVFDEAHRPSIAVGTLWSLWVEVRLYLISGAVAALGATRSRGMGNALCAPLVAWGVFSPGSFPLVGVNPANVEVAAFYVAGSLVYINRDMIPASTSGILPLGLATLAARGYDGYHIVASILVCYTTLSLALANKVKLPKVVQDYSYGIYLYGWVAQQIIAVQLPDWGPYKMMILALPASIILGAASWFLVEKPAVSFRRRHRLQAAPIS